MTIRFYDPDNNLVELGESMPCFCRRLSQYGLTQDEVAAKTGIVKEAVLQFLCE